MADKFPPATGTDFNVAFRAALDVARHHGVDTTAAGVVATLAQIAEVQAQDRANLRHVFNLCVHPKNPGTK